MIIDISINDDILFVNIILNKKFW